MKERYWKVTVVRGHMGYGNNNGMLTFYVIAPDIWEASRKALWKPGVKHRGRIPSTAREITREEYLEGRKESAYNRNGMYLMNRKNERRMQK